MEADLLIPRSLRWAAVVALVLLAPVCAEMLVGYLDVTGELGATLFTVVFLAPLYGGAALLVREVAVRVGLGWPGRLLLAAAFGLAMTGLVDVSLWTEHEASIPYWDQLQAGTRIDPLGLSAYPLLTWVLGHVLLSVGAPLALVEGGVAVIRPGAHRVAWLGRAGLVGWTAAMLLVAVLVHADQRAAASVTPWEYAGAVLGVVALVAVGLRARRGPGAGGAGAVPRPALLVVLAAVVVLATAFAPYTWFGVAALVLLAAGVAWTWWRWARRTSWGLSHAVALGWGATLGQVLSGFATPPTAGVSPAAQHAQSVLLTLLLLVAGWWVLRHVDRAAGGPLPG